jgi:GDP/UDP-N,N'-diacetylbacillosamine 2-epimerase (hydrolysing)
MVTEKESINSGITIGNKKIGPGQPIFIIAEAGVNHDGTIEKARMLIDIAVAAGVDAVKFQTWKTKALILQRTKKAAYQEEQTGQENPGESQFDMIQKLELSYESFRELKQYCEQKGILFLSTPDEEESATFLNTLGVPCFKIGSGELNNPLYLKHVARFGKPIILSTGMGTIEECKRARDVLFSAGNTQLVMLHCTTDYPTPLTDVNMRAMKTLDVEMNTDLNHESSQLSQPPKLFPPVLIGYSDHTKGIAVPIAAAAMGACVIEKHFTYDTNADGPDHKASLSPEELREMVQKIRETETILGSAEKKPTQREIANKKVVRKSIVAKQPIAAGQVMHESMIVTKRADGAGVTAENYELVVGKKAVKYIGVDEVITKGHLEQTQTSHTRGTRQRCICVVTGTRADYGILSPVMRTIQKYPSLDLQVLACGMHLSEEFGSTINDIEKDGFVISETVEMLPQKDTGGAMAYAISKGMQGFVKKLTNLKPDIVVVLGDRIEAFSATVAASFLNIPVAHVSGGDKSKSGRDEEMRHAMTKFAKIHFPATKTSGERIIKMGEDPWRVFVVGEPSIDTMLQETLHTKEELQNLLPDTDFSQPYVLLVQHPLTTEAHAASKQIQESLEALKKAGIQTIVLYPNVDSGGREMIQTIKAYQNTPLFKVYKSLPHKVYLSVLKHAACIVGNSSSGIVEAPTFKLPAINIGIRQEGREHASNVIHVAPEEQAITKALQTALSPEFRNSLKDVVSPYGAGNTSEKIVKVLAEIKLDETLLKKTIAY